MRKKIIIGAICFILAMPLVANAKTLYSLLKDELGYFPTVQERIPLAESCGIYGYSGAYGQNIKFKSCLKNAYTLPPEFDNDKVFGISVDKLSKTIREDISAGTNEATITVDPLVTLQGRRLTMQDIASTTPRLFFRLGSGDTVTWGYCTGMTDNTTTYDLTGCQLGLLDYGPGTTVDTANINAHSAGEAFVITNQHHWYNYYFANTYSTSTIYNTWTFPTGYQYPNVGTYVAPIDNEDLAPKKYVDDTASAGAADATIGVKGLVEIGTATEMASSTPTGSGTTSASLVPNSTMTTSSPFQAGTYIPVTETDGKLNTYFIDKADTFAWTAPHSFSSSTTFTATSTMATTTIRELYNTTTTISTQLTLLGKNANLLATSSSTDAQTLHYHAGNVATGQGTRAVNTTGTQVITHSLGVIPTYIQIQAYTTGVPSADTSMISSFGTATSTVSQSSISVSIQNGTGVEKATFQNANNIIHLEDADTTDEAIGNLSAIDSNTFTINWTTNLNEGSARIFQWSVWK